MTLHADDLASLRIERSASPGPLRSPRRALWIAAAIVLVLLSLAAYRLWSGDAAIPVTVARASAPSAAVNGVVLSATGYIVPHHVIYVNSKVTGRVAWIGVEKGDHVRAGQVLVRLENQEFRAQVEQARGQVLSARAYLEELQHGSRPQEIAQALHNYRQAEANLADDRATLARIESLAAQGIVAKQQLDDARAKFNADQQLAASLQQTYALARLGPRPEEIERARGALLQTEGALAYAEANLAATLIRAPVDGTILDRTAEVGELVTAEFASAATGGPVGSVVTLANLQDLQVELDIAQDDFAKLSPRQNAIVTTDAYPDRKYNGYLAEISPEANREKATVQVKVQIEKPDAYLRPEMNATVRFLANPAAAAQPAGVLIPRAALRGAGADRFVLLAFDGKALRRSVRVVSQATNGVYVAGLNGGETVIVSAPDSLKAGDAIRPAASQ
ncbi:MAG TPA: efflux RND transporter periplasmic adaptor subunit [Terriglobales bacterium]|nr:efflux RND transporter periplasmic adaptor subunit [Terriglobales bacterium]